MKRRKTGKKGEEVAKNYLQERGYYILEKNYRNKYAEIDILAEEKGVLVFVEVRSTGEKYFGEPEDTINQKKILKVKRNALAYVSFSSFSGSYRIDVICVCFNKKEEVERVSHYKNITG